MFYDEDSYEKKDELKRLFKKLGEVINDTLSHSKEVQDILSRIRIFGLGVDLSMVVGLGLHARSDSDQEGVLGPEKVSEGEIRFELTSGDRAFLEHNKIRLNIDIDHDITDGAQN
ncbi:MAG: hypothetical protein ACMUIU_18015 [bacterium]